jgi:hypothetical protein
VVWWSRRLHGFDSRLFNKLTKLIQKNLLHPTTSKASDFMSYKTKSFLIIFNNNELTTALHYMSVFLDIIIADYKGWIDQILL